MTDRDQCAFEEALRSDLTEARSKVMLLTDQLRTANAENQALSYKVDFLTQEVGRVTASREQYERISIRVATFAESVANVAIKTLEDLRSEIKAAAFGKVPGEIKSEPALAPLAALGAKLNDQGQIALLTEITAEQLGKTFGAGFSSADLLPPARFGNGSTK